MLAFLLSTIALSTYKLNQKQHAPKPEDNGENGIHFVKSEIALPEFSLPNLNSGESNFSKKDFAQKKYTLVNFFASWCATCMAEHEILMRLKKSGIVEIYGVAWHDIPSNTKIYLEKYGNPFTKIALDSQSILGREASIQAIPETWLVDGNGVIQYIFRGNLQEFSIAEIQRLVLE